jgi:DNA invertase Pin-like site-specific DNA recombinase
MAVIGYARVSTEEQNLDLQMDALKAAGCDRIFEDHGISAIVKKRSGFELAMKALKRLCSN